MVSWFMVDVEKCYKVLIFIAHENLYAMTVSQSGFALDLKFKNH